MSTNNTTPIKELTSIIQIDGEDYSITAAKIAQPLTIKVVNGIEETYVYDGSNDAGKHTEITIKAVEEAGKLTHGLTIKEAGKEDSTFNGSKNTTIDLTPYAKSTEVDSAIEDLNGNVSTILSDYATKGYVEDVKATILDGASIDYDTLKEVEEAIKELEDLTAKAAKSIQVSTDFGLGSYNATITISSKDPTANEGSAGNIWFKY